MSRARATSASCRRAVVAVEVSVAIKQPLVRIDADECFAPRRRHRAHDRVGDEARVQSAKVRITGDDRLRRGRRGRLRENAEMPPSRQPHRAPARSERERSGLQRANPTAARPRLLLNGDVDPPPAPPHMQRAGSAHRPPVPGFGDSHPQRRAAERAAQRAASPTAAFPRLGLVAADEPAGHDGIAAGRCLGRSRRERRRGDLTHLLVNAVCL